MEEDSKRGKNDEDIIGGILKRNLRIWHGEGVKETSTEDNLMNSGNLESAKVGDNGHEYFFETSLLVSSLGQETTQSWDVVSVCMLTCFMSCFSSRFTPMPGNSNFEPLGSLFTANTVVV